MKQSLFCLAACVVLLTTRAFSQSGKVQDGAIIIRGGTGVGLFTPGYMGVNGRSIPAFNIGYGGEEQLFKRYPRLSYLVHASFIRKGGYNSVRLITPSGGTGSETFQVILNYLSADGGLRYQAGKKFYLALFIRYDYLLTFKSKARYFEEPRNKKDFRSFTGGISYSIGWTNFENDIAPFVEIHGQNDLFRSGDNEGVSRSFNNYFGINMGVRFRIYKEN